MCIRDSLEEMRPESACGQLGTVEREAVDLAAKGTGKVSKIETQRGELNRVKRTDPLDEGSGRDIGIHRSVAEIVGHVGGRVQIAHGADSSPEAIVVILLQRSVAIGRTGCLLYTSRCV